MFFPFRHLLPNYLVSFISRCWVWAFIHRVFTFFNLLIWLILIHQILSRKIYPDIVGFGFCLQSVMCFHRMHSAYLRIPNRNWCFLLRLLCILSWISSWAAIFVTRCALLKLTGTFKVKPGGISLRSQHQHRNVRWLVIRANFYSVFPIVSIDVLSRARTDWILFVKISKMESKNFYHLE